MRSTNIASAALGMSVLLAACGSTTAPTDSPHTTASQLPSPSAEPSSPRPTDSPAATVSPSPTPVAVAPHDEADELFSRPDTCTNPTVGYTLTFPEDWYTNSAVGQYAACSWFTPEFFEVDASGAAPDEIWISIGLVEGLRGYNMLTPTKSGDQLEIDGVTGHRTELWILELVTDPRTDDDLAYEYVVQLGDGGGPTLIASTSVQRADDYELAKAVLDRIMASMELHPRP